MKTFILFLFFLLSFAAKAQFVTISQDAGDGLLPKFPNCITPVGPMMGYYLDTTCIEVLQEDSLDFYISTSAVIWVNDFKYFKNLKYFKISSLGGGVPVGFFLPQGIKTLIFDHAYTIGQIIYPQDLDSMHVNIYPGNFRFGILPDKLRSLFLAGSRTDSITYMSANLEHLLVRSVSTSMSSTPMKAIDMRHCSKLKSVVFDMNFDPYAKNTTELFPDQLEEFRCINASFDTVHYLPPGLRVLELTYVPHIDYFPSALQWLKIDGMYNCLPEYPQTLQYLNAGSGSLGPNFCHPNFVPGLGIGNDLCSIPGNNYSNCPATSNALSGHVFHDLNNDCSYDLVTDMNLFGIPVVIEDGAGIYIKTYTDENGFYSVNVPDGSYTVKIDTSETLMRKTCSNFDYSYNVLFDQNNNYQQQHFQLTCDTLTYNQVDSFDIQLTNVFGSLFRPGNEQALVCLYAQDVLYNSQLNCSSGFQNSLDTLVRFDIKVYGAPLSLSPLNGTKITQTEVNDTLYLTYVDSNFRINNYGQVCVYLEVDSTAQIGDWVCVDAVMTPPQGDMIDSNNVLNQCFEVINSYDPNMKQTWPMEVLPGYDGEFRYTIHFQNTGNAPAINVQLVDTLDSQLDLSTFQVIEASHTVQPYLSGNRLLFKFNNINLADSVSDPEGSKGHVSYRIKLKNAMQLGDQVKNTAHIFFDFNTAIVTNTSTNTSVTSINELGELVAEEETFVLYPNPVQHDNSIRITQLPESKTTVRLIGLDGKVYTEEALSAQDNNLSLPNLKAGVYLVQIALPEGLLTRKLVKL